ncbi:plasmid pRiA4b ORF-3 family protein [Amycolatopsis coloradensis]|uniref:Plasmid pRiA4b ORF-3 family protein n=1 Tax=Amycolatopsis coloradensis TaxID=76021 RepID=A0ACD5BJU8_9PSEU
MNGRPVADDEVFQLEIRVIDVVPECWRRVQVLASITLGGLHEVIQMVMGWRDDHLHLFALGDDRSDGSRLAVGADEAVVTVADVFTVGVPVRYLYDVGDAWCHEITLVRVLRRDPAIRYPVRVAGRGEAPDDGQ